MYYILIYNTGNTPAMPLYDAHPGRFFFNNKSIKGVYYEKN